MEHEDLNQCLDLPLLKDYLARLSKSTVEQMLALYCQQVEVYLNDIKQAQVTDSYPDWQENCHKMKGAAASVGMLELYAKLKVLEKSQASKAEKQTFVTELETLNNHAVIAFNTWLASV